MKSILQILLIASVVISAGCTEDLSDHPDTFIKVYSKESDSNGNDVIELKNGGFLIAGKVSVSAFDRTNVSGSMQIGKLFEISPALVRLDEQGDQEIMRLLPFESIETHASVSSIDLEETGTFLQVIENDDGSFFASGEWEIPDITIGAPWNFTQDETNPMNISFPFLVKLTPDLEVEKFMHFNLGPDWDQTFRGGITLRRSPDGNLFILFQFFARPEIFYPTGYEVWKTDLEGNAIFKKRYERPEGYKFSRDFDIDADGNLVLIGQRYKNIALFRIPLDDLGNEQYSVIDNDGIYGAGFNDNPSFIIALDEGGYAIIYTNPVDNAWFATVDDQLQIIDKVDITGNNSNEYPRAFTRTADGDFLVYTEFLQSDSDISTGYVYRVTTAGKVVFRKPFDGSPGSVLETSDNDILVLSNPIYQENLQKMRLTKMSGNGKME